MIERFRRVRARRAESGSISLFVAMTVVALFAAVGLVIDGGRLLQAIEVANAAAAQGARTAANTIDVNATYASGGEPVIDPFAAVAQGNAAIAAFSRQGMDVSGSVAVSGSVVTATTTARADTVFLSLIGIESVTGTGQAEAVIERGISESWATP